MTEYERGFRNGKYYGISLVIWTLFVMFTVSLVKWKWGI
jgi:hypothetical protein